MLPSDSFFQKNKKMPALSRTDKGDTTLSRFRFSPDLDSAEFDCVPSWVSMS